MTSRATIHRATAGAPQNEVTGLKGSTWTAVATAVPLRLKAGSASSAGNIRREVVGGIELSQSLAQGYMPAATTGIRDNDLIEITSGEWAGTVWRILEATKGDQLTSRRLPLIETTRPAEWDA